MAKSDKAAAGVDNSTPATGYADIAKELGIDVGAQAQTGVGAETVTATGATTPEGEAAAKGTEATKGAKEGPQAADEVIPEAFRSGADKAQEGEKPKDAELDAVDADLSKALEGVTDQAVIDNAKKGVEKIVGRVKELEAGLKTKETALAERETAFAGREHAAEVAMSYFDALRDPDHFEAALESIREQVYKVHGLQPGQAPTNGDARRLETAGNFDPDSPEALAAWHRYENEHPLQMERRLRAEAKQEIMAEFQPMLEQVLGKELGPIKERFQSEQRREAALTKAREAMPAIQAKFGDALTDQQVAEAIANNPNMPIEKAVLAEHGELLIAKGVEYGQKLAPKKRDDMLGSDALSTREVQAKPGQKLSYEEIFAGMGVDPKSVFSIV